MDKIFFILSTPQNTVDDIICKY